jgi:hypothetical protein
MNLNMMPYLSICVLCFFIETLILVLVFHSPFDVGCWMFDVHDFQETFYSPFGVKNNLVIMGEWAGKSQGFRSVAAWEPRRFLRWRTG